MRQFKVIVKFFPTSKVFFKIIDFKSYHCESFFDIKMSSSASASSSSNRSNRRDNNNNDYKMKKKIKKNKILLLSSLTNEMKPLSLIIDTDVVKNKPKSYVDVPLTQCQSEPFSKAYEDTWFSFTKKWYPVVLVGNDKLYIHKCVSK